VGPRARRRTPAAAAPGLVGLLLALVATAAAAGCTRVVAGTPVAAPPHAFPVTAPAAAAHAAGGGTPGPGVPGPAPGPSPPPESAERGGAVVAAAPAALEPDVVADECLLDATQLRALLGRPVRAPEQAVVRRDDGSRSSGCYAAADAAEQEPEAGPVAAVNVYRVRTGTPAAFVRAAAAGGRALTGAGEAAAVVDAVGGSTLQVAGRRFVVTVAVQGAAPDDRAWRAAARAALARLAARTAAR
jgi:hypothetical protein